MLRCPHGSACKPSFVPAPQAEQDAAAAPGPGQPARVWGCSCFQPLEGKLLAPRRRSEGRQKPGDRKRTWSRPANSASPAEPSPAAGTGSTASRARVPYSGPRRTQRAAPRLPATVFWACGGPSPQPLSSHRGQCTPRHGPERERGRRRAAWPGAGRARAGGPPPSWASPPLALLRSALSRRFPSSSARSRRPSLLPASLLLLPPLSSCCLPLSLSPPCPVAMNNTLAWGLE